MHAVDVKMSSDCVAGGNESLSNDLTAKHIVCVRLPQVTASVTSAATLSAS